ncbi:hypothetical protein GCM10020331_086780 [Ectobacillus funiculus]
MATVFLSGVLALGLAACGGNKGTSGDKKMKGLPNIRRSQLQWLLHRGAGGGWDKTARSITKVLAETKLVDQTMTVENKPGGGGTVFLAEYATQDKKRIPTSFFCKFASYFN